MGILDTAVIVQSLTPRRRVAGISARVADFGPSELERRLLATVRVHKPEPQAETP